MKQPKSSVIKNQGLSIIVPTYNGSAWMAQTIDHIQQAIAHAGIKKYEIIIIDDGSTDDTVMVVNSLAKKTLLPISVHSQTNSGRFIARANGARLATYPHLLFVDTRVFIGKESLDYIVKEHSKDVTRAVWCAHVRVDKNGNIYARFWEAIAYAAWRPYFANPRDLSYGIAEFDKYPKGTTCFFIPKDTMIKANEWFIKNTKDLKTSNDDTLLIRHIAESHSINISPQYWCLYHARGSFVPYCKHVFHRGKVFVDGFLRRDGNKYFWPLVGFLLSTVFAFLLIVTNPVFFSALILFGICIWFVELLFILFLRLPIKDGLSLFILTPIFAVFYGAGIWKAVLSIYFINPIRRSR